MPLSEAKAHQISSSPIKLEDCWAKTDTETGEINLTVLDHSLTVGVVAGALYCASLNQVCRRLPLGFQTLIASHDIGKLTPGFQLKATKWIHHERLLNLVHNKNLCTKHAIISQWHLSQNPSFNTGTKGWLLSTGGHHGRYISSIIPQTARYEGGDTIFNGLRDQLLEILIETFGPLPHESAEEQQARIHLLTGLTIFADWIGSNTNWFPPNKRHNLETLRNTAEDCLEKLFWEVEPQKDLSFGAQFNPAKPKAFQPRSIQSALLEAAQHPGLYIVEAPMGMGKTEAALSAAYQLWNKKAARGLYFALPTQLTSEKINERIFKFLENTFESTTIQTLIHGNAWLNEEQSRRLVHPNTKEDAEEKSDTDEALRWYSTTRKQLLAPFGAGTIDQALLAILPAKFAALRCFALAGKVVVIDEVHSFDPYMSALIDRLVHYLIETGSTVIVLSATLTTQRRCELVEAAGANESSPPVAYPLITKVATGETRAQHFEIAHELPEKTVHIKKHRLSENNDRYWQEIASKVEAGANVVVIRNTVALAQETYCKIKSYLRDRIPSDNIGLIHSRFPHLRRLENEKKWTERLGKDTAERPQGSLLVSTQILEQSVDIDADLLVTDLAPLDLILQRIGRLHRHEISDRPKGFRQATCEILMPNTNWKGSAKETKAALLPHAFVYREITLWRAAQLLHDIDSIKLPSEIRPLLEKNSALEPDPQKEPGIHALWEAFKDEVIKKIDTVKNRDVFNALANDDQEGIETRDGIQPTAQLILLREFPKENNSSSELDLLDGESVRINHNKFSFEVAKTLHQHAIRIPRYLVIEQLIESPPWLLRYCGDAVLALYQPDVPTLQFQSETSSGYQLNFRKDLGLSYRKEDPYINILPPENDYDC